MVEKLTNLFTRAYLARSHSDESDPLTFEGSFQGGELDALSLACAWLNNVLMLIGSPDTQVLIRPSSMATALRRLILDRYPQVISVQSQYFGISPRLEVLGLPDAGARRAAKQNTFPIRYSRVESASPGLFAGVNLGQTALKISLMEGLHLIESGSYYGDTWPAQGKRSTEALISHLIEVLRSTCKAAGHTLNDVRSVGLCIGGIVRNGRVVARTGVAASMSEHDFAKFANIAEEVKAELGVPCILEQDAISKAYATSFKSERSPSLIVDIGTSTGGAFIDGEGNVIDILGQLGRVAVDTSAGAIPRPDGQGMGCLSQYLSVTGLMRMVRSYSLQVTDTRELGEQIHNSRQTQEALTDFSRYLLRCLIAVHPIFAFERVYLTGGMLSGNLGEYVITAAEHEMSHTPILSSVRIIKSENPQYDAAIGAALLAQRALIISG